MLVQCTSLEFGALRYSSSVKRKADAVPFYLVTCLNGAEDSVRLNVELVEVQSLGAVPVVNSTCELCAKGSDGGGLLLPP